MFFLGIVLHAAWLCKNESLWLRGVHDFIHSFRMESFFLIAGLFSGMTVSKTSVDRYLWKRFRRLFIPMLFCGIALNTCLHCALHHQWHDFSFLVDASYWLNGEWLGHLWFLGNLLFYALLLYALHKLCPRIAFLFSAPFWNLPVLFLAITFLRRSLLFVANHTAGLESGTLLIAHWSEVLEYVAFFLAGYLLFYREDILTRLMDLALCNLASVVLFWLALPVMLSTYWGDQVFQLWRGVYSIQMCALLFWIARRFFNTPNQIVAAMSDASYTIYLVHWPLMAILCWLLAPAQLPPLSLFSILVLATSVVSYEAHKMIVAKSHFLLFLLNGRSAKASEDIALGNVEDGPEMARAA